MNVAKVQQHRGQFEQAAESLEKVVEIESQLAAEGPNRSTLGSRWRCLFRLGPALRRTA